MSIQAIIFDLGGVLLRTADYSPREKLATRLGLDRRGLEELIFGRESGDRAQRGEITIRQHWDNLCQELDYTPAELQALVDEFFRYDEIDHELLDYVRKLKKTYKTGLLSNAWDDLRQVIAQRWHFEDAFDDMVISAEVKLAKPDRRIFELAVRRLDVEPGQAVLVDDMQRNIDGARAAGLHAIRFLSPQQLQADLELMLDGHQG